MSMTTCTMAAIIVALCVQGELPVRIALKNSEFSLRSGSKSDWVSLRPPGSPPPAPAWPPKRLIFRKDSAYAVWDERGLSVRQKKWVFTTKLPEIPVTPKLFSREEILRSKSLVQAGARSLSASGLSGAVRDGSSVYFLVRWEERPTSTTRNAATPQNRNTDLRPWLEALVKVDLSEEKPKPKLVGRFEGLSLDLRPGKSRLFIRDGRPAAWVKTEEAWGLATFERETEEIEGNRKESKGIDDLRLTIEDSLVLGHRTNTSILQHFNTAAEPRNTAIPQYRNADSGKSKIQNLKESAEGKSKIGPNSKISFLPIGGPPDHVEFAGDRIGWFVERTAHPSRILCRWDKVTLAKKELVETRGTVRLLDAREPWIAVIHEDEGSFLQNLSTGARTRLPARAAFRRTAFGILVWSPASKPDFAEVLELTRWEVIGIWRRG